MPTSCSIKILCADDHPMMREGIACAIESQDDMELIAEAEENAGDGGVAEVLAGGLLEGFPVEGG